MFYYETIAGDERKNFVMPATSSLSPRSKSNSVCEGTSEIIFRGLLESRMVWPVWSVKEIMPQFAAKLQWIKMWGNFPGLPEGLSPRLLLK
ncbi:MAG: hypothetical protein WDO71_01710 [Bacteroidota bacterium]